MEAIYIMLQKKPDWDTAKKEVLSDGGFLDKLKKYVARPTPPPTNKHNQSAAWRACLG